MIWAMTVSRLSVALFHFYRQQKSCRSCELTALGHLRVQSYYFIQNCAIHKNEYLSNIGSQLVHHNQKSHEYFPKGLKELSFFCQNRLCTYLCIQGFFFISYYQGIILIAKQPVSGNIATHDLELSKMETEPSGKFHNYCFEIDFRTDVTYK